MYTAASIKTTPGKHVSNLLFGYLYLSINLSSARPLFPYLLELLIISQNYITTTGRFHRDYQKVELVH